MMSNACEKCGNGKGYCNCPRRGLMACANCGAIQGESESLKNAVQDLHSIVTTLAYFFRDNLPHEYGFGEMHSSNPNLSSETRTQLAVIEDEIKQSDEIFRKVFGLRQEGKSRLTAESPEVRDTIKKPGDFI